MIRIKIFYRGLILCAGVLLVPCFAFGADECRVIEYPDHFEAVCVGDPNYSIKVSEKTDSGVDTSKGAQASKKRQRIADVRSLNAHRFDEVEIPLKTAVGENRK